VVERAQTLTEFAKQSDRDFTYSVASSSTEAPAPQWPEPPYLHMQLGANGRVDVTARPRESAEVAAPTFGFTDDAAGQQARAAAVRAWARGEEAVITEEVRSMRPS
jgi:hypothetical protein